MGLRFRDQDGNWSTPRYIDFESEDAGEYIPSRVEINPRSIDENLTPGNWQGTLSTVDWNDPDANGTYTYAPVNDNTTDNSSSPFPETISLPPGCLIANWKKSFPESADHR